MLFIDQDVQRRINFEIGDRHPLTPSRLTRYPACRSITRRHRHRHMLCPSDRTQYQVNPLPAARSGFSSPATITPPIGATPIGVKTHYDVRPPDGTWARRSVTKWCVLGLHRRPFADGDDGRGAVGGVTFAACYGRPCLAAACSCRGLRPTVLSTSIVKSP